MIRPDRGDKPAFVGGLFTRNVNYSLIKFRASLASVEALPDTDSSKATDVAAARAQYEEMCIRIANMTAREPGATWN